MSSCKWVFTFYPDEQDETATWMTWTPGSTLSEAQMRYCGVDTSRLPNGSKLLALCGQWEQCPTSGLFHFQGMLLLDKKQRFNALKNGPMHETVHFEAMRGKWHESVSYCTKEDSAILGPFWYPDKQGVEAAVARQGDSRTTATQRFVTLMADQEPGSFNAFAERYRQEIAPHVLMRGLARVREVFNLLHPPVIQIALGPMTENQARVIELLEAPRVNRRIIWIWSKSGGTGKSYCRSIYEARGGTILCGERSYMRSIASLNQQSVFWFDAPRGFDWHNQSGNDGIFHALERLSDGGRFLSTFGESREIVWYGHVVVSTNQSPVEAQAVEQQLLGGAPFGYRDGKLSADRIFEIKFD